MTTLYLGGYMTSKPHIRKHDGSWYVYTSNRGQRYRSGPLTWPALVFGYGSFKRARGALPRKPGELRSEERIRAQRDNW